MAKRYQTFEHTADIGLLGEADSLGELFEALAEGLADLICPRQQVAVEATRVVCIEAEDVEALAVDFLSEVMLALEMEHFAIAAVSVRQIDATSVTAELAGEPLDPARHQLETEVKAVTYHELTVTESDGRWTGRVILDI